MILQALTAYYETLLAQGRIAAPGWENAFGVSFGLELSECGELLALVPYQKADEKGKLRPQPMRVPAHVKRSSGVAANFLCDNSAYLLGADEKGKPERAKACFAACAALHHQILDGLDSPAARAVLAFFDTWQPDAAAQHPLLKDSWKAIAGGANLVFAFDYGEAKRRPVTEDGQLQKAWQQYYQNGNPDAPRAQCLITGQRLPVALTHPAIKGVKDAQSSGASLVSFNAPAFCSYGHEQGENAPVSEYAAFAYTTALNALLSDREHRRFLGDTTVVCWAENAGTAYADLGIDALFGIPEESGIQQEDLSRALRALARGEPVSWLEQELQPQQHLYFLGLAPNAARLSVRFFLRDTLEQFSRHIEAHRQALDIVRPAFDMQQALSVRALCWETVNKKERSPSPPPQLAGDLLRAVLTGGRYPATMLNAVTLRIRAEREITRGRAAMIKAYYTRNETGLCPKEVLTVELNEQSAYAPYVLGRLFAVLEAVQDAANPGINATIKDKYFNSACATPAIIFPTLLKLAQKHLQKLDTGSEIFYGKQITSLVGRLMQPFPDRLSLPEQGAFEIGYYHQTQKRFEKRNGGEDNA